MRRVAEVIVVLRVLTSLFFLAPSSGAVVSCAQICRAAGFGADGAERDQALYALRPAGGTPGWRATRPFKMLELLLTLGALILKNGHKTSIWRDTPPLFRVFGSCGCEQSFILLERYVPVMYLPEAKRSRLQVLCAASLFR